ncbi:MAG: response regulator [Desulfobacterales bacterium]|nr:response regulator [Desulfobacterales bacterium]
MNLFEKLRQMKIFLIDDDKWIRDSLSLFFEGEGCHLMAYETAEEALEALEEGPVIFIVDYKLPGMDGLEFFKRIQESHPRAMKILVTAFADAGVVSQAASIGVEDFIEKPFTSKTIEESLSRVMEKQKKDKKSHVAGSADEKEI